MLATLPRSHCDKTLFPGSKLEDDPIESDIYTLLCMAMFMEFIPVEHIDEEQPKTLFMDQVLMLLTEIPVKITVNGQCNSNSASDWLAAVLPTNQRPC